MADARPVGSQVDLRSRISRADEERRRAIFSLRDLEGYSFRGVRIGGSRGLCLGFWSLRSHGQTRPNDHSNCPTAGLFLLVAVCVALAFAAFAGNTGFVDWSRARHFGPDSAPFCLRGRRKKLA